MPIDSSVWGTESGLLDDFDFTAKEAWFGPNPESDFPGINYLHLRGPAYIGGDLVAEEYAIRYSTGKNWEVVGGGAGVESATGALKFHARSGCGEFVARVIKLVAENKALETVLSTRGAPTQADTWKGLTFHMELVTEKMKDRETGEEREFFRQLPVAFTADTAGAKVTPIRGAAKGGTKTATASPALRRAIVRFAKDYGAKEYEEFVADVLNPEVFDKAGDITEELKAEILDESAIWAEAH